MRDLVRYLSPAGVAPQLNGAAMRTVEERCPNWCKNLGGTRAHLMCRDDGRKPLEGAELSSVVMCKGCNSAWIVCQAPRERVPWDGAIVDGWHYGGKEGE